MFQLLLGIIYLSFIFLGLPNALLGSAWPSMYQEFGVPVSYSSMIFMIISVGTVIGSLQSDRLIKKFGAGKMTAVSVFITSSALFGFSLSHSYIALCLCAIPYGIASGIVDSSLNNYVALHYTNRHLNWLHCMWGVGASIGPYIMGYVLAHGQSWNMGYRYVSLLQMLLTAILFFSLPLWKDHFTHHSEKKTQTFQTESLSLCQILKLPGAKEIMITFFCYCALEQTTNLWASSYLVFYRGFSEEIAASFASLFFIGITVGRFLSGFLSFKLKDSQIVSVGQAVLLIGIITLLLPFDTGTPLLGLLLIGLGCAPIYPSIIHSTPENFGRNYSQAMIGVQMASAYLGTCMLPPVFGFLANHSSVSLLPFFLLVILILMIVMYRRMLVKTRQKI